MLMSDTHKVTHKSNTFNDKINENELHILKKHVNDDDNMLIIDDFLSSGTKKEALIRLLKLASNDINIIGIGVLIGKLCVDGRQCLTGCDMPIVESVVSVVNVKDGIIQLLQEDGHQDDNDNGNGHSNDDDNNDD